MVLGPSVSVLPPTDLFQSKELQVMFGHVKKVFVDKRTKDTWLQTSSGMYAT